jgi:two-component system NtrC family sensor kinase
MPAVLLFLMLLLSMQSPCAFSTEDSTPPELRLIEGKDQYLLGQYLSLLEDPDGRLSLPEAMASGNYHPADSGAPNMGVSASAYWVRFTVRNARPDQQRWWLEHADYMYQYLDVWVVQDGKVVLHREGGSMRPRAADTPGSRGHLFALDLPADRSVDIYLRGQTGYYGFLPLQLWTPEAFSSYQAGESVFHGILIGLFLAMILYNLMFYLNLKETSYLLYVVYMTASVCGQLGLNGMAPAWAFASMPVLGTLVWIGFATLMQLSAVLFTLSFLTLSRAERRLLHACAAAIVLSVPIGLIFGFIGWTHVIQAATAVSFAAMLIIGLRQAWRGDSSAIYYSAAFGILILSTLLYLLTGGGGLPFNPLTFYSMSIGGALQSVLLTLALSHRVKRLKLAKDLAEEEQTQTMSAMLQAQAEAALAREEAIEQRQLALSSQQEALEQKQITLDKERLLVEKERMANLGLLSAGIAHEINNPNNFMRISIQTASSRLDELKHFTEDLMGDDTDDDIVTGFNRRFEGIHSQLNIALEGSHRIGEIVTSMRGASRSDAGGATMFDPAQTLRSTIELVKPTFKTIAAFDTNALQTGHQVRGFPSQLNQVFTNFIVNGCQAIEERQKLEQTRDPGVIRLSTQVLDNQLAIDIADDGCGMPDAVKARLFEPFFTTKGADKGTGLGLGICRGIVNEHGGSIEVESMEGRGTTFRILLPLA